MPWIGKIKGLLHVHLSGQAGVKAILRVLSGEVNPSSKLAKTCLLKYEEAPSYKHFLRKEVIVEYR